MATRELPLENMQALEIQALMAQANEARCDYDVAAKQYRDLAHRESELEAQRPLLLADLKARLMSENTGLAATNAEKQAHTALEYFGHLALQRDTVRQKDDAHARMVSAKLRCHTAIAVIKAMAGLI